MELHFTEIKTTVLTIHWLHIPFVWVSVSPPCVRHLWRILPKLWKLARNYHRERICAQDSGVYEWCCSSACGPQAMSAVWQDELEGRSMRGSVREPMAHSKTRVFFLSLPCFYALLILLQLFNFFNLININKAASSPPSSDFLNNFFRQWAYSLLLCQGQAAQITQPPSCISTQGFLEKVSILLCRQWKSKRLAAQPALL